ncbi:ligand-binding sensor domain-containing protein [Taibaiella soli]|uniref:Histidine kinase domain-containing protein n=1 Tax=Taibaiella soli TaxID=1649169 RepID=A0A2W2AFH3_9BACT|nr:two-component regulator propeller domain-containing protein [Taibaiella soli]PZF74051.1 hypothetical protein DN068_04990 [Taibaiella soli]
MKHLIGCVFLLLFVNVSLAQSDFSDYSVRHFTSENGLSQNTVKAIAPDNYGFIWLATETGLLRFDGNNFKLYDKNNTGIQTSRMADIYAIPCQEELMALTGSNELLMIAEGKARRYSSDFHTFYLPATLKHLYLRPARWLHQLPDVDSVVFRLNKKITALVKFGHGVVWYDNRSAIGQTRLSTMTDSGETFAAGDAVYYGAPGFAGNKIKRITRNGIQEVAVTGDLIKLQENRNSGGGHVESQPGTGQLFFVTAHSLYQIIPLPDGNIDTRLLLTGFELKHELIHAVYYDSLHQRIFLGSLTDGLYILDRKQFYTAIYEGKEAHPIANVIYDQVAFSDSSVITGNGTVFATNPNTPPMFRKFPGYDNKDDTYLSSLFRSRNGNIWIGGINELYVRDPSASKVLGKWMLELPKSMTEDAQGRLWIGTEGKGLFRLNPRQAEAPQQILSSHDRIMCMEWEGDQLLWISTVRHLLRLHTNTNVVDTIHALTDKTTRSLYIPEPGTVWICTYEDGLFLWQNGTITHFPFRNYPPLKTVHKILEDNKGFFWISTNYGLYRAKKEELLAFANNKKSEPYLLYYNKEAGFLTNEFNGGSQEVGVKLRNGVFSFSSMNGVVFFKPGNIRPELPDSKMIIDKLEVDDREVLLDTTLTKLHRDFKTLKITVTSAYMGNLVNLRYEYKLNSDTDWRKTYNGTVILSSLPPGQNTILIRKRKGFSTNDFEYCGLNLYMPRAWWQTGWFYLIALVGLALLVWAIVQMRVRYWQRRNRVLEVTIHNRTKDLTNIIHDLERSENKLGEQLRFQRMLNEQIAHDITTPLKYLTMFTKNVMSRSEKQHDELYTDLEHIHQGTDRIYEVVQQLGQYMRSRLSKNISGTSVHLHELAAQKLNLFKIAAEARHNTIDNRIAVDLSVHQNESLISIILHNLIDNAVKNTEHGTIVIDASTKNGLIKLTVADSGKGLSLTQIKAYNDYFKNETIASSRFVAGFGFLIIKEIATLLKIKIKVMAGVDKGLVFELTMLSGQLTVDS